ncbi:MAG: beta-hydroxyacyl-ACP dehydratase [Planctomycetaceae bacterium]|nr:beta-hydroxyacyl-ACP dehydratase [Planctomycetaceae bacterium]
MSGKDYIIDPASIDFSQQVADIEAIQRYNQQRGAMHQLTAIVYDDSATGICIGYRDVSQDEFWHSGHMPGMPLMPGVIMCEAAAQVCSFHSGKHDLLGCEVMGFGGLDNVRFRGVVVPGQRLTIVCQVINVRRGKMISSRFQGFVDESIACEGELRGVPLPIDQLKQNTPTP